MTGERIFIDTWFVRALLNARDARHKTATEFLPRIRAASELVTSDAVITEFCNGLAALNRAGAASFARGCYADPKITVVAVDQALLQVALDQYSRHSDKAWGLTDCISFVIMREHGLQLVATRDHHFRQAGFTPLFEVA